MEIDDTNHTPSSALDALLSQGSMGILEEYQLKVQELTRETNERELKIKRLQKENEQLLESATRDITSLESKE